MTNYEREAHKQNQGIVIALIIALILCTSSITLEAWTKHYTNTSSPIGQHCWNEVNATQPNGIEKICMANN
jgi:hypothetical protein